MIPYLNGDARGLLTQSAGTRIQALLCAAGDLFTNVINVRITTQGTAHTLTLMRGASRAKAASALAATGTALVVDAALTDGAGAAIAANDYVGVRLDDGSWHLSLVSAWDSATKTITLATAIPTGRSVLKGARCVCYGVAADAFHSTKQFTSGAGATNNFPVVSTDGMPLCKASYRGEPVLLDINNATAASTLEHAQFAGTKN